MIERQKAVHLGISEGLFSALSVGFFFLLVGVLFIITPNLFNGIQDFLTHFTLNESIPHLSNVFVPVPTNLGGYTVVYTAAWQFSLIWGVFQIIILALRFMAGSPVRRKARTAGNMVFWLGTAYFINTLLTSTLLSDSEASLQNWFVFWAAIITLIGVSLVVRAVILAAHLWFS